MHAHWYIFIIISYPVRLFVCIHEHWGCNTTLLNNIMMMIENANEENPIDQNKVIPVTSG